ncbi:MAG: hypothetical protein LBE02_05145 [Spirochaetaceae bacterium]|jgi:hypothetical protein|nr:hypothetical protein [Spirochaetaceae bacterium]
MRTTKSLIPILSKVCLGGVCLLVLLFYSCNTILFYEKKDGEESFLFRDKLTENDDVHIYLTYLEQENLLPWSNFQTALLFGATPSNSEKFQAISVTYDIYTSNGMLIDPVEEHIDIKSGNIYKYYKYSLFFPRKIKVKVEIRFYFNDEYREYLHETIITKRRNRSWWSVASGI